MANLYFPSLFENMWTMFLGLSGILHIMCSLLLMSTPWMVNFFWYRDALRFCWFLTLFPKIEMISNMLLTVSNLPFLNTKINREKSGDFCTLRICHVQICWGLLFFNLLFCSLVTLSIHIVFTCIDI